MSDTSTVHSLGNAGVAPKEIRSYIRNYLETLATQQDIYNCIAQDERDLAKDQSNTLSLVSLTARDFGIECSLMRMDGSQPCYLPIQSLAYLRCHPDLLILDCTYKTNKYKMPLLDIVGVDACQTSFCAAFAFLSGEVPGELGITPRSAERAFSLKARKQSSHAISAFVSCWITRELHHA